MNDLSKWHKYPLEVTRERLAKTDLFTKREEILSLIEAWRTFYGVIIAVHIPIKLVSFVSFLLFMFPSFLKYLRVKERKV